MILLQISHIVRILLSAYLAVLTVRMILDWVAFLTHWQPGRVLYPLVNAVYTLTTPPIRWVGKIIPPLRLGVVALDMGFMVLYLLISLLIGFLP